MGNENPRNDFDQENWQALARIGVKSVLKNRMTGSLLDLYQTEDVGDHLSSKGAEEIFQWRKERATQEHIPLLFHYEVQRGMLGSSQRYRVFTEHLTRLIELPPFSKQEAFLLLEHILEVLPLLYKQVGLFHANLYTVGVNGSGSTKIWVNENLAINHPDQDDVIRNPSQNLELTIVNNLVRMLKTKVYNNEIKPEYPFSVNFLETGRYIKETRQRYPQYEISKVYLNRNQFNQVYKATLNQKVVLVPQLAKQEQGEISLSSRKKGSSPRKIPTQITKTESSDTPMPFYPSQAYSNSANQPFINHHSQPIFYYPPNVVPLNRMPVIYTPPPNQLPFRNAPPIPIIPVQNQNQTMHSPQPTKERQLEQSYYINPPSVTTSPFQTQPIQMPSPTQVGRKTLSPSKFLKKASMESPKSFSPKKQASFLPNRHSSPSNRSLTLSPTKKHPSPTIVQNKPHDLRPISANNPLFNRQLSRILQQQQTKYDSLYLRSPDRTQQGFNVQLVESIYVKSSETEEGL